MTADQAAFLARLDDYRRQGAQGISAHGVEPDMLLQEEVVAAGVDQRYGVNFIVRPPLSVRTYIQTIQTRLRTQEPEQYFYPPEDLHLTLLELCSSRTQSETESLATRLVNLLSEIVQAALRAVVVAPRLAYDRRACAVNFLPLDHALQALRDHLITQLAKQGVTIAPRYAPQSAHVTIMRYLRPLQSDRSVWLETLETLPSADLEWEINQFWLTWGVTWYGRQGRSKVQGPYPLS